MNFKKFLESYYLTEAFNVGDVAEGIFAIAIANLITTGTVNQKEINEIRSRVNPKEKENKLTIDANIADNPHVLQFLNQQPDPDDKITVILKLMFKPSNISGAYGPQMKKTRADKMIQTIIEKAKDVRLLNKVKDFVKEILTNQKPDDVNFYVTADGAGNAVQRGVIKSDVSIKIEAKTNSPIPKDIQDPIKFSLKTGDDHDETTVFNTSGIKGAFLIAQHFNLPMVRGMENVELPHNKNISGGNWMTAFAPLSYDETMDMSQDEGHFLYYIRKYFQFRGTKDDEKEAIGQETFIEMFKNILRQFVNEMEMSDDTKGFEDKTFDLLKKSMFGDDMPDVVSISNSNIKEINVVDFEEKKKKYDLDFTFKDNSMIFRDKNSNAIVFRIRLVKKEGKTPTINMVMDVGNVLFK